MPWCLLFTYSVVLAVAVSAVDAQLLQVQLTPDLEQPGYQLLRVTKDYEIRRYDPFIVAETALPAGESEWTTRRVRHCRATRQA